MLELNGAVIVGQHLDVPEGVLVVGVPVLQIAGVHLGQHREGQFCVFS